MHPILEIALGVALGMTVFIVISWILGMCVYIYCNKSDNIATAKKLKSFKANTTSYKSEEILKEEKIEVIAPEEKSSEETSSKNPV
jgi:hypothetical protein